MKRFVSILAVLALVLSLSPAVFAEDSYIPAPYDPNEVDPTVTYLEPVFYQNENGPTIGVTTVGVIVRDGLYFKDLNNNKALDPAEDWRPVQPTWWPACPWKTRRASCSTPWRLLPACRSSTWPGTRTAPSIPPPS